MGSSAELENGEMIELTIGTERVVIRGGQIQASDAELNRRLCDCGIHGGYLPLPVDVEDLVLAGIERKFPALRVVKRTRYRPPRGKPGTVY